MYENLKNYFCLILPWLLLGFLAYKDRCKNMIISQAHLFLFKTYYYTEENGEPSSYSITLMNAEMMPQMGGWQFNCVFFNKQNLPIKWVDAEFMPMYTDEWVQRAGCKLTQFRLKCNNRVEIRQNNIVDDWIMKLRVNRSALIETYVERVSSTKRHRLVFCPNRIYNFERWQVFLTTMELYRQYGVELTIVHVQSVYPEIYDLMQYYVREGRLQFRDYLGMPMVDSLSYNPNSETVFTAQNTHMLDCLFAFRENTDFLILADWDDIVVAPNQQPIPLVLDDFLAKHPSVASFYLQRLFAFIPTLEILHMHNHSIYDFWNNGIGYEMNSIEIGGKSIVRPALVDSVEIHQALVFKRGYEAANMPADMLQILHARYQNESMMSMRLNTSFLSTNFEKFMKRNGLTNTTLWAKLPREERMVRQIVECFNDLSKVLHSSGHSCNTHYSCPMVDIKKNCLTYSNKWEPEFSRGVSFSVFRHSNKLEMSQSCKSNVF